MKLSLNKIEDTCFFIDESVDYRSFDAKLLDIAFDNHTLFKETEAEYELKVEYIYNGSITLLCQTINVTFLGDFSKYPEQCKSDDLKKILLQFQNIGIGLIRGVIAVKTKDSGLNAYPLPLIEKSLLERNIDKALKDEAIKE